MRVLRVLAGTIFYPVTLRGRTSKGSRAENPFRVPARTRRYPQMAFYEPRYPQPRLYGEASPWLIFSTYQAFTFLWLL
jgi:hypothetical protein